MVSSVTNNLNSLFASFSDVGKVTAPQAQAPVDPLQRVTGAPARETLDEARQRQQQQGRNGQSGERFSLPDERQATLASFTRPRPLMAPSEEMAVFAQDESAPARPSAQEVLNNSAASAQLQVAPAAPQRRQSYVANLYAQANDVVFNGDRTLNQAA